MSSASSPQSAAGANSPTSDGQQGARLVEWGDEAIAAQAAGSLKPAWKKFIKTKFFVAILRSPDDDPRNFLLHLVNTGNDGTVSLIISEVRERLDLEQGDGTVALSGADILRRLVGRGGIQVALRDATFNISKKRVEWLHSGIEETKARVVIRKILQAAAPKAPLPVLRVTSSSLQAVPVVEDESVPRWAPLLASPYFKPAMLALAGVVAVGVIAAFALPLGGEPEQASVPPPFEAPLPVRSAANPGVPTVAPTERTMTFSPMNNSFRVTLPGQAEEVELSPDQVAMIGHLPTNNYRLLFDGRLYTMESTDYITRSPEESVAEMDARQKSLVGTDGRLLSVKQLDFAGGTGREVRVRMSNGGIRAARLVFVGSRFSMIAITAPKGDQSMPQIDAFLTSFHLN